MLEKQDASRPSTESQHMRISIAVALLWPALIVAQDSARQQSFAPAQQAWRQQQATVAVASETERARRRAKHDRTLADLERMETTAEQAFRDFMSKDKDVRIKTQYADSVVRTANDRRERLQFDDVSAARLDSIRRVGDFAAIREALVLRRARVARAAKDADVLANDAARLLREQRTAETSLKGEDSPSNPPSVKAYIKAAITYNERYLKIARTALAFETNRASVLFDEQASLDKQIAAAQALEARP